MTNNELLTGISALLDQKLQPLKDRLQNVEGRLQNVEDRLQNVESNQHQMKLHQENVIMPQLDNIMSCYTSTYERYKLYGDKMDSVFADVDLLKKTVAAHSEKLQKLA